MENRIITPHALKAVSAVDERLNRYVNSKMLFKNRLMSNPCEKTVMTGALAGLLGGLMCVSVFAASNPIPGATTVSVSLSGMSIYAKAGATPRVMAAATNLATILHQITGATFPILTNGNGTAGIALGVKGDFPSVSYFQNPPFDGGGTNCTQREDFLLLAHTTPGNGIYICGATELAVEDAVWDFLHKVGYRYYFPNSAWEIIPNLPSLIVDFNVHENPDFLQRQIWSQGGNGWPNQYEGSTNYADWQKKNRAIAVNPNMFGQWGWGSVMEAYPQEFNFSAHPDYFPMINGARTNSTMFCPLNPAVLALCASYCTNYIATHPGEDVVSMVPPDRATGFCDTNCTYCGTNGLSDRMVLLANYCGVALRNAGYINKRVCILIYSSYFRPPVNTIEPEVVALATPDASGGKAMSFGDLINQWNAKRKVAPNPAIGSTMGVYQYYSQLGWGADRPNKCLHASDFNYVADEIPSLYNRYKIRYMSMESEVNFGICGFGYYLASRLLWDTTLSPTAVRAEFLTNCFGTAECQATMREFYDQISEANRDNVVNDFDTVGRMYKLLQTALTQANGDQKVIDRINQQVLYTRYCELYDTFEQAPAGAAKTNAMAALAPHLYRMKDLDLVHTFWIWFSCLEPLLPAGDIHSAYVDEGTNPWKVTTPFSAGEYTAFITNGLAAHPPHPWPKRYSKDLVKATPLNLPTVPTGYFCSQMGFSGDGTLYTWIDPGSTSVTVYTTDESLGQMMYLYSSVSSEANLEDRADVVHTALWNTPATICEADRVTLGTTKTGLHRMRRMANYLQITWADGVPMTIPTYNISINWADSNHPFGATMYFYVPKGTTNIWFTSTGGNQCSGLIKDSSDALRYDLYSDHTNEMFAIRSVAVPTGQDGKLWKIEEYGGIVHFYNIPPYIARNGAELLLPREVVEADGPATYGMSVASTMYAGGTLPISWTASAGHSSLDWITILNTNGSCVEQRTFYTGTTNTSGVITNRAPITPGTYTIRYFLNDGYTEVTEIRKTLTVTAWPGSLTATPSTVAPNGELDVSWVAPAGHEILDWIGIFNDQNQWIQYSYPNTTATSGSIEWWAPSTPGNYTIHYFINDSWESVCSIPLTVGGAYGMTVASTMYAGGTLPISWTAPASHSSLDWITILNTNGSCVGQRSFYTGTTNTSGVITNWAPSTPGTYTIRYFLNDGYTEVEEIRKTLTVTAWPGSLTATPSTVTHNGDLTIDWTAPDGHSYWDWIAIINSQGGVYEYCNPYTTATSGSIELSAPSTPGNYTIRFFIGSSYEWVDSIPLTVQ